MANECGKDGDFIQSNAANKLKDMQIERKMEKGKFIFPCSSGRIFNAKKNYCLKKKNRLIWLNSLQGYKCPCLFSCLLQLTLFILVSIFFSIKILIYTIYTLVQDSFKMPFFRTKFIKLQKKNVVYLSFSEENKSLLLYILYAFSTE